MTLMLGAGPFGQAPAGRLSVDVPRAGLTFLDPYPRRLRGVLAGTVLVDSHRACLLHEHGHLPRAYFPRDDVRMDLLAPGSRVARSATRDGGTYWAARVGGRVAQDAAWSYPDPPLDGLVAFHVGALETASLFHDSHETSWQGLLATYVVTNTNDSGAGSLRLRRQR